MKPVDFPMLSFLEDYSASVTCDLERYRHWRKSDGLYKQSLTGPGFYALAVLIISYLAGYMTRFPVTITLLTSSISMMFLFRFVHRPPELGAEAEELESWYQKHWILIHVGAGLWGVFAAVVCWYQGRPDNSVIVTIITTIAFSTGASYSYSMDFSQASKCLVELLFFPALTCVFFAPELRATGLTLCIAFIYLIVVLRISARNFRRSVDTEVMLIESRTKVLRLSRTDPLTGLDNRRSYELSWQHFWQLAARQRDSISLLVFDLDHFKLINDAHGHLAGDMCLKHFADMLQRHIRRASDVIARIGGEEFVAILPSASLDFAINIAENLRFELANSPCTFEGKVIPMSVSIGAGVANWHQDANPVATFARVDAACYRAKASGRNRVIQA